MQESLKTYQPRPGLLLALILIPVGIRLLPYLMSESTAISYFWGMTPLFAIGLFGAAYFSDVRYAYLVSLTSYFLSDLLIAGAAGNLAWGFYSSQPFVYLGVALNVLFGTFLRTRRSWGAIAATAFLGGVVFFIVSNFGVWIMAHDRLETPLTIAGLMHTYVLAIPFYRAPILSTLVFTAVLFSPLGVRLLASQQASQTVRA